MRPSAPNAASRYCLLLAELQRRGMDLARAKPMDILATVQVLAQTTPHGTPIQTIAQGVAGSPGSFTRWMHRHPESLRPTPRDDDNTRHIVVPAGTFTLTGYDEAVAAARSLAHTTGRGWLVLSVAMEIAP